MLATGAAVFTWAGADRVATYMETHGAVRLASSIRTTNGTHPARRTGEFLPPLWLDGKVVYVRHDSARRPCLGHPSTERRKRSSGSKDCRTDRLAGRVSHGTRVAPDGDGRRTGGWPS